MLRLKPPPSNGASELEEIPEAMVPSYAPSTPKSSVTLRKVLAATSRKVLAATSGNVPVDVACPLHKTPDGDSNGQSS